MKRVAVIDTCAIINLMYIDRFTLLDGLKYAALTTMFVQLEFDQGHEDSRKYFYSLLERKQLIFIPLEIDDLIEMTNLPRSKRASDAELSCFVVARRLGCRTMTDDGKAAKFANNHLGMSLEDIFGLVDLLLEAYESYLLGDHDLRSIQKTLEAHKFKIQTDLTAEAARRRLMASSES